MKDEIKEILDYFKRSNKNKLGFEQDKIITYKEANQLLDYITNLQEERNMFKGSFETMSKNYFEEKSRNEKAIEYIKSFGSDIDRKNYLLYFNEIINKALNILNGDDE